MTTPAPTPLERALKELQPHLAILYGDCKATITNLGAALLRQDAEIAASEPRRPICETCGCSMLWNKPGEPPCLFCETERLHTALAASREREAKLRAALLAVERPTDDGETCAICGCVESVGHVPDCIVGRALADTSAPEARPAGDDARASELRHAMNRRQR